MAPTSRPGLRLLSAALLLLCACDAGPTGPRGGPAPPEDAPPFTCSLPEEQIRFSLAKDVIPALTNPPFVEAAAATYLRDGDRVLGLLVDGHALAVPHNILWHHEVVNLDLAGGQRLAVTYCPLTGSGLVFDRAEVGGAELGVSGLLFQNNLILYDRSPQESLWPQLHRTAGCGPRTGTRLPLYPVAEMTWEGWRTLHPDTRVLSDATGASRNYRTNPYSGYEQPDDPRLLYAMPIDPRRPPKERVLGLPSGAGGLTFPFGALDAGGPVRAIHAPTGPPIVVFWHRAYQAAAAYHIPLDFPTPAFEMHEDRIYDVATRSEWGLDGRALSGPLAGHALLPVQDAYVAFWFAWAAFQPRATLWTDP